MSAGRVRQTTLRNMVALEGVGVHSGRAVAITISPAPAGSGLVFALGDARPFRAVHTNLGATELCTTLTSGDQSVATVEHLLAALAGLEVDNALIDVAGPEIPVMDGSAADFVAVIDRAGIATLAAARRSIRILRPLKVEQRGSFAELRPYEGRRFEIELDYASPVIGRQRFEADISPATFRAEIAGARTFGFLDEVELLRSRGLARGASLDNVVVIGKDDILNSGGLRFADEFARHKALDAIGDLALAGAPILGLYRSYRGGHALNAAIVETLMASPELWEWTDAPRAHPVVARTPERVPALLEPELT